MSDALTISKLEDSAAGRALQAATQAPLSNFVDFTSTLVANVFDTLVDNSIKQTRAYADLVASVAGTVDDFETKTLGNIDDAALKYLNDVVLSSYDGTPAPLAAAPASTSVDITTFTKTDVSSVYAGVTAMIGPSGNQVEKAFTDCFTVTTGTNPSGTIKTLDLFEFTKALLKKQLHRTYDDLRSLVAMGVQGIDIIDGTLKTSLTFHTDSVDSASVDATNTRTNFDSRTRDFAGYISHSGSTSFGGKIAGFFLGRSVANSYGGRYSDNSYSSTLNVTVLNEKKTAVTNLAIDITGSMTLNFRTKSFPTVNGNG